VFGRRVRFTSRRYRQLAALEALWSVGMLAAGVWLGGIWIILGVGSLIVGLYAARTDMRRGRAAIRNTRH
jgi:uncharacterized membrane protein YiaA